MSTSARRAGAAGSPDEGLGPRKTVAVLAVVVGCFAVLWPRVLQPAFTGPAAPPPAPAVPPRLHQAPDCCGIAWAVEGGRFKAPLPLRPAPPPINTNTSLHRVMLANDTLVDYSTMYGDALRERGRTLPNAPRPRSPLEAKQQMKVPASPHMHRARMAAPNDKGGGGRGSMGFVMPLYTLAILIFFLYTLSKVWLKRSASPQEPNNAFREHVFRQDQAMVADAVWGLCSEVDYHHAHSHSHHHSPESNNSQENGNIEQIQRKLEKLLESEQELLEEKETRAKRSLEREIITKSDLDCKEPLDIKQVLEQIQLEEKQQLEKQHLEEKQMLEQRMHELELERLKREDEQRQLEALENEQKESEQESKPQLNGSATHVAETTTVTPESEQDVKPTQDDTTIKTENEEELVEEEVEEEIEEEVEDEEEAEGERSTLKVLGFETSAHAVDGTRVAPQVTQVSAVARPEHVAGQSDEVSEIYLRGGAVPHSGRVLVATMPGQGIVKQPGTTHAPLVVSGKVTLSLIPDDTAMSATQDPDTEEADTETLDYLSIEEPQEEGFEEEEELEEQEIEIDEQAIEHGHNSPEMGLESTVIKQKHENVEQPTTELEYEEGSRRTDKELDYHDIGFNYEANMISDTTLSIPETKLDDQDTLLHSQHTNNLNDEETLATGNQRKTESIQENYTENLQENQSEIDCQDRNNNHDITLKDQTEDFKLDKCKALERVHEDSDLAEGIVEKLSTLSRAKLNESSENLNTGFENDVEIEEANINPETVTISERTKLMNQLSETSQDTVVECKDEDFDDLKKELVVNEQLDQNSVLEADMRDFDILNEELDTASFENNSALNDPPLVLEERCNETESSEVIARTQDNNLDNETSQKDDISETINKNISSDCIDEQRETENTELLQKAEIFEQNSEADLADITKYNESEINDSNCTSPIHCENDEEKTTDTDDFKFEIQTNVGTQENEEIVTQNEALRNEPENTNHLLQAEHADLSPEIEQPNQMSRRDNDNVVENIEQQITDLDDADSEFDRLLTELETKP